jgi:hypothetical protein
MLTAYQCEVIAYWEEDGLLCLDCAYEANAGLQGAMSRYAVDEYQSERAYDDTWCDVAGYVEDWPEGWVCGGCAAAVTCEQCGAELVEEYCDGDCGVPDES